MKKLALILLFCVVGFSNIIETQKVKDDENLSKNIDNTLVKEYQEMFEKIGEQRVGLKVSEIEKVRPPFLKVLSKKDKEKNQKAEKKVKKLPTLVLEAILGKSVRINGTWYKLHQKIRDAKIVSIKENSVFIKSITFSKKLTLRKSNAKISIK